MSRTNGQQDFQFSSSREQDGSTASSISKRYDIHPMELVVQSVLGEPLEELSNQLQGLHESQVILIARLSIIEEKLKKYQNQLEIDINVKETEEKLNNLKKKLTAILQRLIVIEQRVQRKITQASSTR